ncbi:MAG: Fic family protein [Gammaproteobacteria bacterium]|nr:MAG: Fic family protein [Gammaproteobacteria bacterium]
MYRSPSAMEPLMPEAGDLPDLAVNIYSYSAALGARLHPTSAATVGDLLRVIKSYYSNLIEGHNTHPLDIERAMKQDYSKDPAKRNLQTESLIHIEVQRAMERRLQEEPELKTASSDFLCWLHREFYDRLPEEFKWVKNEKTGEKVYVEGGKLREQDVEVGAHVAPSSDVLSAFMARFAEFYEATRFSGHNKLLAVAAAHHRLAWIHPFLDGNGRVVRLFTDAGFARAGLGGWMLWSAGRGLARSRDDYMAKLANADAQRRGDLDGRGNLSLDGLNRFCRFFLETCLDQINYMDGLVQLDGLVGRIRGYVALRGQDMVPGAEPLKPQSAFLLEEALIRGEFARGEAPRITGLPERSARLVLKQLLEEGLLLSDSPKGLVRLGIPVKTAAYLFPQLYPDSIHSG